MCKLFKKKEKTYTLKYDYKDAYQNGKDQYKAGDLVVLKYDVIATDTSYSFYLNGEHIDYRYIDNAFMISFKMPECDSYLECRSLNMMLREDQ